MKPQPFAKFCASYGFELTPAQRVLGLVCFDGVQPADFEESDREIALQIFGTLATIPTVAREVLAWVKGARIGGTRMGTMRLYQLGHAVELDLAHGERGFGLIVGPDMRLARQSFAYALGCAKEDERSDKLAIIRESKDSFEFERHDGHLIAIECLPATQGGSAVRGRTLVGAVMTEGAFFRDKDFVINDTEVYRALAPRIVKGGQLIVESTPWAEAGLLFDLFTQNHGRPTTALACHCPTTLMRPDERTRAMVERERLREPDNAAREFDAAFMSAGSDLFFDPITIDDAMRGADVAA